MERDGKLSKETYIPFLKEIVKVYRRNIIIVEDGAPYHPINVFGSQLMPKNYTNFYAAY